ncbi:MAG: hypothetical protein V1736_02125 [Pseudomonadota bacterium]
MGALSVGDVRTGTIPSLLPSQKHYLKVYNCGASDCRLKRADRERWWKAWNRQREEEY